MPTEYFFLATSTFTYLLQKLTLYKFNLICSARLHECMNEWMNEWKVDQPC